MSDEKLLVQTKIDLRSSLVTNKQAINRGIPAGELLRDYKECLMGGELPYRKLGFRNIQEFLESIPDVVQIIRTAGEPLFKLVSSEATANIEKLVSKQRSKKTKGSRKKAVSREPQRRPTSVPSWRTPPNKRPQRYEPRMMLPAPRAASHRLPLRRQPATFTISNKPVAFVSPTMTRPGNFRSVFSTPGQTMRITRQFLSGDNSSNQIMEPQRPKPMLLVDNKPNYELPPRFLRRLQEEKRSSQTPSPPRQSPPRSDVSPSQSLEFARKGVDEGTLKNRVLQILKKKPNGLWDSRLGIEYSSMFNEAPPPNLLSQLQRWNDVLSIEEVQGTEKRILYPVSQSSIQLVQTSASEVIVIPQAAMPVKGTKVQGFTCHVLSPTEFFVQKADSPVLQLQDQLEETYASRGSPKELSNATPGTFCVAKFNNVAWYRAQVISASENNGQTLYEVFYVDYGNKEKLGCQRVRRILANFAELPAQAIKCRMARVFPKGSSWTPEDVEKFSQIYDFNKELLLQITDIDGDTCEVLLYDGQDISVCLNDVLVQRGIAIRETDKLPKEPDQITLPTDNEWEVFVSFIGSGCDIIIRLIGQQYSWQLEELESRLGELENNRFHSGRPMKSDLVAVKVQEEGTFNWYRCRVVENYLPRNEVGILFLDHGDTEIVPLSNCRPLLPKYNQLPYQAVPCKLSGLEPYAGDDRLLSELKKTVLGKTFWCEVNDRVEHLKVTLVDTSLEEDLNMNTTIARVLQVRDLAPKLPEVHGTIDGFVSHVGEFGRIFFAIQGPGLQKLDELHEEMEKIYAKVDTALMMRTPEIGTECVAKYVEANYEGWYRAVIHQLYPAMRKAAVYFVDYGNSEIVSYANLRVYSSESQLLKSLPFQAIEVELHNLPPEGGQWSEAAYQSIREICPMDQLRTLEVLESSMVPRVEIYREQDKVLMALAELLPKEMFFSQEATEGASKEEAINVSDDSFDSTSAGAAIEQQQTFQQSLTKQSSPTSVQTSSQQAQTVESAKKLSRCDQQLYEPPKRTLVEPLRFDDGQTGEREHLYHSDADSATKKAMSPLKVDIDVALKYSSNKQSSPSPAISAGTSSSWGSLPSPSSPGAWGDEVPTPDVRTPESWAAPPVTSSPSDQRSRSPSQRPRSPRSPTSPKSPSLDDLPSDPRSPTDNREVIPYEDLMTDYGDEAEENFAGAAPSPSPSTDRKSPIFAAENEPLTEKAVLETTPPSSSHSSPLNSAGKPVKGILKKTSAESFTELNVVAGGELLEDISSDLSSLALKGPVSPPFPRKVLHQTEDDPIIDLDAMDSSEEEADEEVDEERKTPPLKKNVSFSEPLVEAFEEKDEMPPPLEKPNSGDEVFVTWAENPHNFRCIAKSSVEKLRDQTESMHQFYTMNEEEYRVPADQVEEGQLYAAFHEEMWYRVLVKKVIFNQVAIHFVDFGDFTVIPKSRLRFLLSDYRQLPFQAMKARLAGVESNEEHWPENVCERFTELTLEKTLTIFIHASQDPEFLCVTLVNTETSAGEFIHKILLEENLAKKPECFPVQSSTRVQ